MDPDAAPIAVDAQADFMPGGALAEPDGDAVVPAVNRLGARFAEVVLTQDWHPRDHASFASRHPSRSGTPAARLIPMAASRAPGRRWPPPACGA